MFAFALVFQAIQTQSPAEIARIQSWNPDPSLYIETRPDSPLADNPDLAKKLGIQRFLQHEPTHTQLTFTFVQRSKPTLLTEFISLSNATLIKAVPNKVAQPVDTPNLIPSLEQLGLQYKVYLYPNKSERKTDADSICESAAVFIRSDTGFWTLSTNGDPGNIEKIQETLDNLFAELKFVRVDSPAAIR